VSPAILGVVCRPALAAGFGLAGVRVTALTPGVDPGAGLEQAVREPDLGLLLVEEPLYDLAPVEVRARLDRLTRPVVVPFPGAAWDRGRPAEERMVELLRRAIGYRVRLS
jgi:vacuolar-type H+-ATPase subunit F/Vma7